MRSLKLVAVLLTTLALVPSGAHFFELFNKIGLPAEPYFIIQGIYRGWAAFGYVWITALIVNLALAAALWRRGARAWPALTTSFLIALSFAVFFAWIYPANRVTANWTIVPANWLQLRTEWEYGHAVDAVLLFAALGFVTWAATGSRD